MFLAKEVDLGFCCFFATASDATLKHYKARSIRSCFLSVYRLGTESRRKHKFRTQVPMKSVTGHGLCRLKVNVARAHKAQTRLHELKVGQWNKEKHDQL